jgi:cytochrome P450
MTDVTSTAPPGVDATDFVFNPFEDGFAEDPYPHYAELRERAPVQDHPMGFWVVSSYEGVQALLRSGQSVNERNLGPGMLREISQAAYGERGRRLNGLLMLDNDPPDHTRLRRLVAKAFTPRAIDALEERVVTLVDEALDRIADAGEVDLVATLAYPLPFQVISEMLGMPEVDHERLRELSGLSVRATEPIADPTLVPQIIAADDEMIEILQGVIDWKRENPADDLLTGLIEAEDGDRLSTDELVAQVVLLYIAGHETEVNLLSGGTLALLRHPEQLALLRENPDLAGNAVDELLRYDSPSHIGRRITIEPYQVGGMEIPPGAMVIALLASANRDPLFWGADVDEVKLDRPNARQHLAFGAGLHHCLGAALARMEAKVAFSRLVHRFPGLALRDVQWNGRINLRGPSTLTVSV